MNQEKNIRQIFSLPVLVAALGYLVDMYDLFLFNIVRVPSFTEIGVVKEKMLSTGLLLLNLQMAGMLIGGLVWGILGDKRGRLSVLFGSILIYSLANIGNGFVTTIEQYAVLRFIAGFGLAGELGAGITLVAEILPKATRGYGTLLVSVMGLPGAIAAYFVGHSFDWRTAYIVGGVLGLTLLIMRISILESGMFSNLKHKDVKRGNLGLLFGNSKRAKKYLFSILIGFPIWFVVGILISFADNFVNAEAFGGKVDVGYAVMLAFSGQVGGNLVSGFLSQYLKSRKKAVLVFMLTSFVGVLVYLFASFESPAKFYAICVFLGFCNGYWTLFITIAAELFGTNIRATVATTVPNFVRASTIPLSALFLALIPSLGTTYAALTTGVVAFGIALGSLWFLEETFNKDLDYVEE